MAETALIVVTLTLIVLLNVVVVVVLLQVARFMVNIGQGAATRGEKPEAEVDTDEIYPLKNIGEEEAVSEAEAAEVARIWTMSRYAASPDDIIAGILREDEIREKRG